MKKIILKKKKIKHKKLFSFHQMFNLTQKNH